MKTALLTPISRTIQNSVAGIAVPDSKLATEATDLLLEHGTPFLYNHSLRVFFFGALLGKSVHAKFDLELLYISAVFHDLGLTKKYSSADKRFEVDGANAARAFLLGNGLAQATADLVWDAIALHTTIGIAEHKQPEVALLYSGVGLDVMGDGYEKLSDATRREVTSAFPRDGFKKKILHTFLEGFAHKPQTTFGNIKADVCARLLPGFKRTDFCDCVLASPWSE